MGGIIRTFKRSGYLRDDRIYQTTIVAIGLHNQHWTKRLTSEGVRIISNFRWRYGDGITFADGLHLLVREIHRYLQH